ncbi:MAG: nuclear transport factor 2 family protein [Bacteroidales bacterium]
MKRVFLLLCMVSVSLTSVWAQSDDAEKEAIKEVIQNSYVDGLQNNGDVDIIREGFHPGFNLLGVRQNALTKYPIYSWLESFQKRKFANPNPPTDEQKVTSKYLLIDITGNAAMAKIELWRNDVRLFTDYLQLYKFEEGWRIVSKIYHRHE